MIFTRETYWSQVEQFVLGKEQWARLDKPLWKAEQHALRDAEPRRKADALVLCVKYALKLNHPHDAKLIASRACDAILQLDAGARDHRAAYAIELFLEQVDAFDEAKRLAVGISQPIVKVRACLKVATAAVGTEPVRPWIKLVRDVCESGDLDEPDRSAFLEEAKILTFSAKRYAA